MSLTTDPNHPELGHGVDSEPIDQHKTYLVLSEEERAKGFVRPVRTSYVHKGVRPVHPLVDLTPEQQERYADTGYLKFEAYPVDSPESNGGSTTGRFWTKEQLESGCGSVTTMGSALAETYARNPKFYGSTYCCVCRMHKSVEEFVWDGTNVVVGT